MLYDLIIDIFKSYKNSTKFVKMESMSDMK